MSRRGSPRYLRCVFSGAYDVPDLVFRFADGSRSRVVLMRSPPPPVRQLRCLAVAVAPIALALARAHILALTFAPDMGCHVVGAIPMEPLLKYLSLRLAATLPGGHPHELPAKSTTW